MPNNVHSAPEPHISGITKSFNAGREQALSAAAYDPPIWIRQSVLYSRAFLNGYQSVAHPAVLNPVSHLAKPHLAKSHLATKGGRAIS